MPVHRVLVSPLYVPARLKQAVVLFPDELRSDIIVVLISLSAGLGLLLLGLLLGDADACPVLKAVAICS